MEEPNSAPLAEEQASKRASQKREAVDEREAIFVASLVNAVLAGQTVNEAKKKAAEDAGYTGAFANKTARHLLKRARVQERIRDRLAASGISDAEIVGVPASIVRYSLADCINVTGAGTWEINLVKAKRTGAIHAIRKLGYDAKGRPTIEMHDPIKAADLLANIRGLKRAEAKPDDIALRRMAIEDSLRDFRERFGDEAAEQYRRRLAQMPDYRPYMDVDDDRTQETDPAS